MSTTQFDVEWRESAAAIAPADWERCFGRAGGFAHSHAYQLAVEASAPEGVEFHHLLLRREDELVAIVGCFRYPFPLAVVATEGVRKVVAAIERLKPGLFSVGTFFVGQLTAVCDHLFGLEAIESDAARRAAIAACRAPIAARAQELGCALTVFKEIPQPDRDLFAEALGEDYVFADSLPNTFLEFAGDRPYLQQIRKKYRGLYRKRARAARARGLSWQVVDGAIDQALAAEMERLYLRVMRRSDNQFERLPAAYFRELCARVPESFAILCRDGEELVGFSLNLEEAEQVVGLYLGFQDDDHSGQVYYNLLYKVIEVAEERGKRRLQLGQTSYEVKSSLGARPEPTHVVLHVRNRMVRRLLRQFRQALFPPTDFPERTVFPRAQPAPVAVGV